MRFFAFFLFVVAAVALLNVAVLLAYSPTFNDLAVTLLLLFSFGAVHSLALGLILHHISRSARAAKPRA